MNKQIKLERIVSDIKLRFDVEPEIQGDVIIVDATLLPTEKSNELRKYVTRKCTEVVEKKKEVLFILTL